MSLLAGRSGVPRPVRELLVALHEGGVPLVEVAAALRDKFGYQALVACRLAAGLSQRDTASEWSRRWPNDVRTFKNISYWENWRTGKGYKPNLEVLDRLARIYRCRVTDLLVDCGDYRDSRGAGNRGPVDARGAAGVLRRSERLEADVAGRWPGVWQRLDGLRRKPLGSWPYWCLVPEAAVHLVTGHTADNLRVPVGAVSALYTWRFSRSVYVFAPELRDRLDRSPVTGLPEAVVLRGWLPEWCVYLAGAVADRPRAAVWAFLDCDYATGGCVLRLVVDLAESGVDGLQVVSLPAGQPIPEQWRAPDDDVSRVVAGCLPLLAHLGTETVDIVNARTGGVEVPRRRQTAPPAGEATTWMVGLSG